MVTVSPFLWYSENAREAAEFYVSLIPNSRIESVTALPADSPAGPAGSVEVVDFVLAGQKIMAMAAGPLDPFNHAISLMVECDSQEELDRLWDGLLEGGTPEECGWLRDRYGLAWQITPRILNAYMAGPDREAAARVARAMLTMTKFDIAALEAAYRGEGDV